MSTYTGPNTEEFNNAESSVLDIMSSSCPNATTKLGSVVRELVVRPMAYLYAWMIGAVTSTMDRYRMSNLLSSMRTDNDAADDIASLFFTSRRQGTSSRGAVSLVINTGTLRLPAGFGFNVAGVTIRTEKTIIAMGLEYKDSEGLLYVPCVRIGDSATYRAIIPVVADSAGSHEIEAGSSISMLATHSAVISAELVSPVTGGSDTETDASMLTRAMASVASGGVGSYYGISRKLLDAPVNVLSIGLVAGEDAYMNRGRNNVVNICAGGVVDCYAKTQVQASVDVLNMQIDNSEGAQRVSVDISGDEVAGLFSVVSVSIDGEPLSSWSTSFASSDSSMDGDMARLGCSQVTKLSFDAPAGVTSFLLTVAVSYMPGISLLQDYIDNDANRFIGQNMMIKAAVPVSVQIACAVHAAVPLDSAAKEAIINTMCNYVNSIPIGTKVLNFSDISDAVASAHPGVYLRLPCTLAANNVLIDGTTDSCYSTSGLLDISEPVGSWHWDSSVSFFSLVPTRVRLEEI